jgi:O-methyltransferase
MSYITYDITTRLTVFFQELMKTQMQCFARGSHIVSYALQAQDLEGDVVEFGTFEGHTARLLSCLLPHKTVHVYDSFEGAPENNEGILPGICKTSLEQFESTFINEHLPLPVVHKGLFSDLIDNDIPEKICYAHIDANLYSSTIQALEIVYSKMVPNGIIIVDDCPYKYNPGVQKAVEEFFSDKDETLQILKCLVGYPDAPQKTLIIKK